MSDWNQ